MTQLTVDQAMQIALQHHQAGQLPQAEQIYRQVLAQSPGYAPALHHLGLIAEAHSHLGIALRDKGRLADAVAALQHAIALKPDSPEACNYLGGALADQGHLDEAIAAYRRAITLRPNYAEAHNNLGNALSTMGQVDEAIAAFRKALALLRGFRQAHSNLLLTLHYDPAGDAQAIAEEHRHWGRQYADPLRTLILPHANERSPERRLRIGYVSPDFKQHAVAPMVLPLLACHDRENFQVFCYAQVQWPDAVTERFRAQADQWRSTVGLSDEQMATLVRQDQIDILVNLAGHTGSGRLLVFARKPAPVQISRQGYPNTTGLSAIDYRMTDAYADPPGLSDALHTEQLVRLPRTNWIYQPPENAPAPSHQAPGGAIAFGCFNNLAKVTEPMMLLWGRILGAVPRSRLLLKAQALSSPGAQQRVREFFARQGIDPARLELRGWEAQWGGHLALYNRVDIALDPYPYHGTTTTCEALWMGVPVITLAGQTHVSRVGVSLLTNMGLTELIAASPQAYYKIAVELANDLPRLRSLHATLRHRMERSPLMDAPRFAREIEAFYRQAWRKWCRTGGQPEGDK